MTYQIEPWNIINELNSLFENSVQRNLRRDDSKVETSHWLPLVDIKEDPNQYVLVADLPGVDPQHIDISMENNVLVLKGSREKTEKQESSSYYRVERVKGEFYRRFTLPDNADGENIKAKSKNGVLEICIPKKQQAIARKIEVSNGE